MKKINNWFKSQPTLIKMMVVFILIGGILGLILFLLLPKQNQPTKQIPIETTESFFYKSVGFTGQKPSLTQSLKVYRQTEQLPDIVESARKLAESRNMLQVENSATIWISEDEKASIFANIHNNTITYTPNTTEEGGEGSEETSTNQKTNAKLTQAELVQKAQQFLKEIGQNDLKANERAITNLSYEAPTTDPDSIVSIRIPFEASIDDIPINLIESEMPLASVFISLEGIIRKVVFSPTSTKLELVQQYPSITFENALDHIKASGGTLVSRRILENHPTSDPPYNQLDVIFDQAQITYRIINSQAIPHYTFGGHLYLDKTAISQVVIIFPAVKM